MIVTSFEFITAVLCIISAFVGYSLGEYFTKREVKNIIKKIKQEENDK